MARLLQLEAYHFNYKDDLICVSETYLDCSIWVDDHIIQLKRYNLSRAVHSNNTKRGSVCIYYRELLGIKVLSIPSISLCLLCEV